MDETDEEALDPSRTAHVGVIVGLLDAACYATAAAMALAEGCDLGSLERGIRHAAKAVADAREHLGTAFAVVLHGGDEDEDEAGPPPPDRRRPN